MNTAEKLFYEYQHIAIVTVNRLFPDKKNMARLNNIEPEDIDAYATEGLWDAALNFDPTKGNRTFRNFAINSIRWKVLSRLAKDCKLMSFAHTGVDPKKVKYISLDSVARQDGDGCTYHELVKGDDNFEGDVVGKDLLTMIENKYTDYRIPYIIKRRIDGANNSEIGRELGLSREWIRKILNKVKNDLQGVI